MKWSIGETASRTGVSLRTLRYYDEIGLLRPAEVSDAGYRYYDERALTRLQQILFLREIDMPLQDVARVLDDPRYDAKEALEKQRALLLMKRERLDRMIALAEKTMKGESDMDFTAFDNEKEERVRQEYAKEAREKWGATEAYRQSEQKAKGRTKADWATIQAEVDEIFRAFAACMDEPADGERAQAQVEAWRGHITRRYYDCTPQILASLGEMYVSDARFTQNIDRFGDGLAAYMRDAIRAYCAGR